MFHLLLAKAKCYYLIQKLRNRTKTFGFISQISTNKTELFVVSRKIWKLNKPIAFGPKILKFERERFVLIMNFVSKTNIFNFWGDVCRKTKAKDLKNVGLTLLHHTVCLFTLVIKSSQIWLFRYFLPEINLFAHRIFGV